MLNNAFVFAETTCPHQPRGAFQIFLDGWNPTYNPANCELKNLNPVCAELFQSDVFKNKDWKKYAAACESVPYVGSSLIDLVGGCFGQIKEFGDLIGETAAKSTLKREKYETEMKACNASPHLKVKLLLNHNRELPLPLKFAIDKKSFNLAQMTCEELSSRLNRNFESKKAQWLAKRHLNLMTETEQSSRRTGYYAPDPELTSDEREVREWFQKKAAEALFAKLDKNALDELKERFATFSCYNTFYNTKLVCSTVFTLAGLAPSALKVIDLYKNLSLAEKEALQAAKSAKEYAAYRKFVKEQRRLEKEEKARRAKMTDQEKQAEAEKLNSHKSRLAEQIEIAAHDMGFNHAARKNQEFTLLDWDGNPVASGTLHKTPVRLENGTYQIQLKVEVMDPVTLKTTTTVRTVETQDPEFLVPTKMLNTPD